MILKRKLQGLLTSIQNYFLQTTLFFTVFLFLLSCDHTDLNGEIVFKNNDFVVGDSIQLFLKIPNELDGIYWIHWEVEPREFGEIIYSKPSENKFENDVLKRYGKEDRKAVFIPSKSGEVKIFTYGYFKQTNPQMITSLEVDIVTK
jgi:hypothetical protein